MKIAIINKKIMQPDKASGCKRLFGIIEILAIKNEIYYFPKYKMSDDLKYKTLLENTGVKVYYDYYIEFIEILKKEKFDIFFLEFYSIANEYIDIIKIYQPNAIIVTDSVDVHFERRKKEVEKGLLKQSCFLKEKSNELEVYKRSDITIVVSEEDKVILENNGINNISVITNIVPLMIRKNIERTTPNITFVGGFGHAPNIHALQWFLDEVWNDLKVKIPDVVFNIVGSKLKRNITQRIENMKDVNYLGYVPDIQKIYDNTTVSIAPLTYGGGVKGKVNEAMACGVPLVTTSVGVEGIPAIHNKHCFISNSASEFTNNIIELISNIELQNSFSKNSQKLAEQTCGIKNAKNQIESFISKVIVFKKIEGTQYKNNKVKVLIVYFYNVLFKQIKQNLKFLVRKFYRKN